MLLTVSIVAILCAIGVARFVRHRARQRRDAAALPPAVNLDGSGRFHALSIRFGSGSCEPSRALHGLRFLADAAPELPLKGCDAAKCRCRFVHHRDRRVGVDRRSPYQQGFGGSSTRIIDDRRESRDRRRNQQEIWQ